MRSRAETKKTKEKEWRFKTDKRVLIDEAAKPAAHGDSPEEGQRIQLGNSALKTLETLPGEEEEEEDDDDGGA